MVRLREIAKQGRGQLVPVCCSLLLVYFGYHAIYGERGLLSWLKLSQAVEDARQAVEATGAERARLARRVALLRADGLDADMLDERARFMLSVARADEVVIYEGALPAP